MTSEEIIKKATSVDDRFQCGVYFLIDQELIVYVGQSRSNIIGRITAHKKDKIFDRYHVIECKESDLDQLEAHYISQFTPIYNRSIRSNDKLIFIKQFSENISNHSGNMRYVVINNKLYADITGIYFHDEDLPF